MDALLARIPSEGRMVSSSYGNAENVRLDKQVERGLQVEMTVSSTVAPLGSIKADPVA